MLKDRQFIFEITMKRKRYVKFSWVFLSFLQIFLDIYEAIKYNEINRYDHATECAGNRFERGSSAHAFVRPHIAKSGVWEYNMDLGTYFSVKYYIL